MVRNATGAVRPLDYRCNAGGPGVFSAHAAGIGAAVGPNGAGAPFRVVRASPRPDVEPGSPNLYELTLDPPRGPGGAHAFAVRDWSVGGERAALLNGRPVSLRGASFHEQTPARGWALGRADRDEIVQRAEGRRRRLHAPALPAAPGAARGLRQGGHRVLGADPGVAYARSSAARPDSPGRALPSCGRRCCATAITPP